MRQYVSWEVTFAEFHHSDTCLKTLKREDHHLRRGMVKVKISYVPSELDTCDWVHALWSKARIHFQKLKNIGRRTDLGWIANFDLGKTGILKMSTILLSSPTE